MAEEETQIPNIGSEEQKEVKTEPVPLSNESASAQLELDVKPKAQDKNTRVHYNNKNLIASMVNTPKEKPGGETQDTKTSPTPDTSQTKESIKTIQEQLAKEQEQYEGEKPSEDECKDTADMFVFILDMGLSFLASKFALDKDDKEYQIDTQRKKTLTKYLAIYLAKMNKKYPIGFMLCITAVVCCLPVVSKAYNHRKMVEEERAKNKRSTVIASDSGSGKKRRRRSDDESGSKGDDDIPTVHAEVVG